MATVTQQLDVLRDTLDLVAGRVPAEDEARARGVLTHASKRLAAGPQTVVALAGATGSGKSSLFNAISGTQLAQQGARRPTTSTSQAASFSATNTDLLDLLGVKRRHEVAPPRPDMAELILLDLPDHDSTAASHREEVDRMITVVDQFVWVLDPQKYADAAIHKRYLQPLARHREVITVVLNQADRLTPTQLSQALAHIRQLLEADGLGDVPLLATSALTGQGVDDLRTRLGALATAKKASSARLAADVAVAANGLDAAVGRGRTGKASGATIDRLTAQLAASAGVPLVADAVRRSVKHRGQLATGWPVVKWLAKLRPDPLKRLRLGAGKGTPQLEEPGVQRSSLPSRSSSAEAQLSTGLRILADELSTGMPPLWQEAVGRAVHRSDETLADSLDRAVVATDLRVSRTPVWWQLVRGVQWLLIAAVVVGVLWLTLNVVLGYFGLPQVAVYPLGPEEGLRVPVPTALIIGGVAVGLLLSLLSQLFISVSARRTARRARKALEASVREVAEREVLAPAEAEVARYAAAREQLDKLT
ncbi:GTPase [Tessaracoccus flavus]|uniref:G domain-containing protein n=1 Tax=Tessaracoccus flavus TaxID=1610493 RepID=A0A1Q2CFP5_9ACTN|nr:GTPase [Tessaracoccus flavus]AQP44917.1 hypothetical protein RPIT_09025 [Tessaracoccus flavus]SDY98605.1 GTP-binding protein EngB required for normal cell division [Tessaracoccus flavus]